MSINQIKFLIHFKIAVTNQKEAFYMLKRVIITIGCSFLMAISCVLISIPALAVEDTMNIDMPIISPQYTYINSASSTLTISGGTPTIKGSVTEPLFYFYIIRTRKVYKVFLRISKGYRKIIL